MLLLGWWIDLPISRGDCEAEQVDCAWCCRLHSCPVLPDWRKCNDVFTGIRYPSDICNYQAGGVPENRVTMFFSGISMEIYLSHMVIFRVVEKLKLNRIIGNGWLQYVVTSVLVIAGATVFAVAMQKIISKVMEIMNKRKQIA